MKNNTATRVISYTSGKGGVGKTTLVLNTALALQRAGRNVLLLDADLGLANIDVMLGIQPKHTIHDLLNGTHSLEEVMVDGPFGLSILPAATGIEQLGALSAAHRITLMQALESLAYDFDYLFIDTQAGISSDVMYFNSAASEIVCIINPEPTSLTDTYALIKVLAQRYGEKSFSVVANNVCDEQEGRRTFQQLSRSVDRFLHVELKYLGAVPTDSAVRESIRAQRALLELFPSSQAGLAIAQIARRIDTEEHTVQLKGGMQFFFERLLTMSSHGG